MPRIQEAWIGKHLKKIRRQKSTVRRQTIASGKGFSEHHGRQNALKKTLSTPYSPITEDYENHGLVNQIKLNNDVWSAALLAWLVVPWELKFTSWGWVSFIIPPQISLIVSITFQSIITYWVMESLRDIREAGENTCDGTTSSLRLAALCVFVAYGTGTEIMEALTMNRWISCFPDWNHEVHSQVIEEVKRRGGHMFTAILCRQKATNGDGFSAAVPAIGLPRTFKWFARIFYIFLRICIALIIMIEASGIILYSSDNLELISGTIMAKYILEIDDYLFKALVTAMMKTDMNAIPPIGISPGIGMTNADGWWHYNGSYYLVVLLFIAAYCLQEAWCNQAVLEASLGFSIPVLFITVFLFHESKGKWQKYNPLEYLTWDSQESMETKETKETKNKENQESDL
jgi:hypothetical protein